jgi:phosphatidylglycerophosphate synthase
MSALIIRIRRQPGLDLLASAALLVGGTLLLSAAGADLLELGSDFLWRATSLFVAMAVVIGFLVCGNHGPARFGPANRITLTRVALLALVASSIGEVPDDALRWAVIGVTTVALILDGFDGRVARRSRSSSSFGARFDMETDAALIMVLSVLCWQFGQAGVWVLLAGGMRYGFVLASKLWSWLRVPLPASRRRQTVCILQSAGLLAVLSPLFTRPASDLLAAALLVMLSLSFAADIRWLSRRRTAEAD